MKVIEAYREFLKNSEKLDKVYKLRENCYQIFSQYCTLDEMEAIITDDWKELLHLFPIYIGYGNIPAYFTSLKNGFINRYEFSDSIKNIRESVDSEVSKLETITKVAFEDFSTAYNEFFAEGEKNAENYGERLIYHILLQPETKNIIMEFFKQ